ncbi:MAG TPA: type I methionyl aminopeptidase [Polyangia bacterium]|nr:type I methionyl aminopeptidase [Polyangia bacterium]
MSIYFKSQDEIAKLRKANLAVAAVLDACEAACKPGITTWDLNEIADRVMKQHNATSAFLGYHGYPAVLCTSVNEVVVHGIPRKDVVLEDGDIVGIDFGCFVEGFCGDSARTIAIGEVTPAARKLMDATRESLERAIAQCVPGNRLQDIGWAVQSHVEPLGYSVVRTFVGHGIGKAMHEDPPVPNYGSPGRGLRLKPGLVLAIEPMVNAGAPEVEVLADRWTAVTKDRSLSAHFEHSVAITENGPIVLSRA